MKYGSFLVSVEKGLRESLSDGIPYCNLSSGNASFFVLSQHISQPSARGLAQSRRVQSIYLFNVWPIYFLVIANVLENVSF